VVPATCLIRPCACEDLRRLEWDGLFAHHRDIFERTYAEQLAGHQLMLVADIDGEPCGQIWIDLRQGRAIRAGVLWGFRVHPDFQRMGIGTRLLLAAEAELRRCHFATARLLVDATNRPAMRLYDRFYQPSGHAVRRYAWTTPDGDVVDHTLDVVQMVKPLPPRPFRRARRAGPMRRG
jgi:ribosomal protein S18 acetylase RimI-like enzyme